MTTSVPSVGSVQCGALQIIGTAGTSVRVLARLYDPDNELLISTHVASWSEYLIDRAQGDIPVWAAVDQVPSSTVLGTALTLDAKWTKDSTGYVFNRLLPPAVAALLLSGHAYILRYEFQTPGAV